MKKNVEKLNRMFISGFLNAEDYYTVSIGDKIRLQGKFKASLVLKLRSRKFKSEVNNNGYIEFTRSNITIVLTD